MDWSLGFRTLVVIGSLAAAGWGLHVSNWHAPVEAVGGYRTTWVFPGEPSKALVAEARRNHQITLHEHRVALQIQQNEAVSLDESQRLIDLLPNPRTQIREEGYGARGPARQPSEADRAGIVVTGFR